MVGEYRQIPFLGVNLEPLSDQLPDGVCENIENLRPDGDEGNPFWVPIRSISELLSGSNSLSTAVPGLVPIRGYIQILKDFSGTGNRDKFLVMGDVSSERGLYLIDETLDQSLASITIDADDFSATRIGNLTLISIHKAGLPIRFYYLEEDTFIEAQFPDLPEAEVLLLPKKYTQADVDLGVPQGIPAPYNQPGGGDPSYFCTRVTYRTADGTDILHSQPAIKRTYWSNAERVYQHIYAFLWGYPTGANLGNVEFWSKYIKEVAIYMTNPKDSIEAALNDGNYFEVASWSGLENIPDRATNQFYNDSEFLVNTEIRIDNLATNVPLVVDNFTNHRTLPFLLDTYNKRLLAGGSVVDFASPKTRQSNYTGGDALNGVVISDASDDGNNQVTYILLFTEGATPVLTNSPSWYLSTVSSENNTIIISTRPIDYDLADTDLQITVGANQYKFNPFLGIDTELSGLKRNVTGFPADHILYTRVKIDTDNGSFYRYNAEDLDINKGYYLDRIISYPDRRAKEITYFIGKPPSGGGPGGGPPNPSDPPPEYIFTNPVTLKLKPNRLLNFAYNVDAKTNGDDKRALTDQDLTFPNTVAPFTDPGAGVNEVDLGVARASLVNNPFVFDAAATYDVSGRANAQIKAFAVNSIETSEGQFGQYPLYVFTDVGIYALEQTGDPLVAFGRLTPISAFHNVEKTENVINAERIIIFLNSQGVYSLVGNQIQRISDPVFLESSSEYMDPDFFSGAVIGFDKRREEVWFSNTSRGYSVIFNVEYGKWYRSTRTYDSFFYNYPTLYGISGGKIYDFDSEDLTTPLEVKLKTRPFNFGNPYVFKRLRHSVLRTDMIIDENQADLNQLEIQGDEVPVFRASLKRNKPIDVVINRGRAKNFVLDLKSTCQVNSVIHQLEANFELRYGSRARK
jgi:hypothetical protein